MEHSSLSDHHHPNMSNSERKYLSPSTQQKSVQSLTAAAKHVQQHEPNILCQLNCPTSYHVNTRHSNVGITNSSLDIIRVLFIRININHKATNQMVYIFMKLSRLFSLSTQ